MNDQPDWLNLRNGIVVGSNGPYAPDGRYVRVGELPSDGGDAQAQPLPCPFCGAKASRHKDGDKGSRWEYHCPHGHTGYLRMKEWNMRTAKPAEPAQPADSGRVNEVTLREAAEEALTLLDDLDPRHGITTQLRAAIAAQGQSASPVGVPDALRVWAMAEGAPAGDPMYEAARGHVREMLKAAPSAPEGDRRG